MANRESQAHSQVDNDRRLTTMLTSLCLEIRNRDASVPQLPSPPSTENPITTATTIANLPTSSSSLSSSCSSTHHSRNTSYEINSSAHKWNNLPLVSLCNVFSYLLPNDRLNASATCTAWRNVIYHSSLWPQKHLRVNLCPHKFTIPSREQNEAIYCSMSGFHIFTLRQPLHHRKVTSQKQFRQKPNWHNSNEPLKDFIHGCSRLLTGLTIYFDPNSSYNVIDLIKILKHISENEVATYDIDDHRSKVYANCRNLKSLVLVPVTPLVRSAFSERFVYLYYELTDVLQFLFSKCQFLEHISLGNLHELVYSTEEFLKQFCNSGHDQSLRSLHLSSIKGDVLRYIPQQVSFEGFEKFCSLQHLSIDFDVLDTKAIELFCKLKLLKGLTINVHRVNRYHPGIKKEAWSRIITILHNLQVTVNLLHTESNHFDNIFESIISTDAPLKIFRAYYLEFKDDQAQTLMCNLLETLALRHRKTLETLAFVDHLERPKRYLKLNSPNALVMLSWQCRHLRDLSIIGFELSDIDIIAIARLRGPALRSFHFPSSCIQLTKSWCANATFEEIYYYCTNFELAPYSVQTTFNNLVGGPLNRIWQPISIDKFPEIFLFDYIPQMTYHRTLLEPNYDIV